MAGILMVASLVEQRPLARQRNMPGSPGLADGPYVLTILQRPADVDSAQRVAEFGFDSHVAGHAKWVVPDPQDYLDFFALGLGAAVMLTGPGGLQEVTTYLGPPCLTSRSLPERPITIEGGTTLLSGANPQEVIAAVTAALDRESPGGKLPELWDSRAAGRIASVVGNLA